MTHRMDPREERLSADEVCRLANEIGLAATPELLSAIPPVLARFPDCEEQQTRLLAGVNAIARLLSVLCREAIAAEPERGAAMCSKLVIGELDDIVMPGRRVH